MATLPAWRRRQVTAQNAARDLDHDGRLALAVTGDSAADFAATANEWVTGRLLADGRVCHERCASRRVRARNPRYDADPDRLCAMCGRRMDDPPQREC